VKYNLLQEPWIPVLRMDGSQTHVGIRDALARSGLLLSLGEPSATDNLALLRLLIAVTLWCRSEPGSSEIEALRESRGIPEGWLARLDEDSGAFELFGDGPRFYQDGRVKSEVPGRPASDLLSYFPAATEINHFRHIHDDDVAICPACCALGLIRLPVLAIQGGAGKSPSINNAPPVYFIRRGRTLLDTLMLNMPRGGPAADDSPVWKPGPRSSSEIGTLEGFTWQPRAVWLGPTRATSDSRCSNCGRSGPVVSSLVFAKGQARKDDTRSWRDPHVHYTKERTGNDNADPDARDNVLRASHPLKYAALEASLWRRTASAIMLSVEPHECGTLPAGDSYDGTGSDAVVVECIAPFTSQGKVFDEHRIEWRIPRKVLHDDVLRRSAFEELDWLGRFNLRKLLGRARGDGRIRKLAARCLVNPLICETERRLFGSFVTLLWSLAQETSSEQRGSVERWRREVLDVLASMIQLALTTCDPGSALKRRQMQLRAVEALRHDAGMTVTSRGRASVRHEQGQLEGATR